MNNLHHLPLALSSKDIAYLTQKSPASVWRLRLAILRHVDKPRYSMITIEDFCSYTKLDIKMVMQKLQHRYS